MHEKIKILIVEDEVLVARDIKESLQELNYSVCEYVASVAHALKVIQDQNPDIALIDIHLKGKGSGIDLGKILMEKDTIPFIYLTSFTNTLTLSNAKNTRPSGFLVKPFKQLDVHVALQIALNNFAHRKIDFSHNPQDFIKSGTPFRIQKVVNYINDNIDAKIQLADLASLAKMSTFHFSRTFKNCLKMPPLSYVSKIKIEKSKGLLCDTDMDILQVALEVGFENQSYFCQVFKKYTGQTPEHFRHIVAASKNQRP